MNWGLKSINIYSIFDKICYSLNKLINELYIFHNLFFIICLLQFISIIGLYKI